MDDMYSLDNDIVPDRVPIVKMVKKSKKSKKALTHEEYVKMDAECLLCDPIKVNKNFDQRLAAALMALSETGRKVSRRCKTSAQFIQRRIQQSDSRRNS